jgi:hypothetical protein
MWRRRKPLTMAPPPEDMWFDEIVEKSDKWVVYAVTTPSGERVLYRVARRPFIDLWGDLDPVPAES